MSLEYDRLKMPSNGAKTELFIFSLGKAEGLDSFQLKILQEQATL